LKNPYVVIFNLWDNKFIQQINDYATLEEALEEAKLINIYYADTPKPIRLKDHYKSWSGRSSNEPIYGYSNGGKFWGFIVIDYNKNEIVKIGHDGLKKFGKKITLNMKDYFLRDANEIPENYQFDMGEYDGWLQYRWGDGKNAVDYVEPKKEKKNKIEIDFETGDLSSFPTNYNTELIESKFEDLLSKETKQRLLDRW
jgi:hypothetical protein